MADTMLVWTISPNDLARFFVTDGLDEAEDFLRRRRHVPVSTNDSSLNADERLRGIAALAAARILPSKSPHRAPGLAIAERGWVDLWWGQVGLMGYW
ncbi:MAG: hypothetical protein IPF59_14350 [Ignavibacteria bacterium]|nr:hypothetical protein [Ignavibacteria bacterium]